MSLLDDSEREARNKAAKEAKSSRCRPASGAESRQREGQVPRPHSTPAPFLGSAWMLSIRTPSLQMTWPVLFLPAPVPQPPRQNLHPAAHRGRVPLPLPRLSKIGKHPAPRWNGNRPLPVSSLPTTSATPPTHFRPAARSKHGLSRIPAHFLYVLLTCLLGCGGVEPSDSSLPKGGPETVSSDVPGTRIFGGPPESLARIVLGQRFASPEFPNSWSCAPVKADSYDSFPRGNLGVNDCFREEPRR